jgi:meso-butanediol dehydrogenase/(S,S)-butanediol dehydrogenase/diacetyl reductase
MGNRLKGRNIVVTGAGSGIGAGIAADLADNGANVVVADINVENGAKVADQISKAGGKAVAVPVDVSNRESIKKIIAETVEAFGSLDVKFNNAGIIQTASYLEITVADWKRLMDVNGLGVLMGTQEVAKQMIAQGRGGKIINTASIGAQAGLPAIRPLLREQIRGRGADSSRSARLCRTQDHGQLLWAWRCAHGAVGSA